MHPCSPGPCAKRMLITLYLRSYRDFGAFYVDIPYFLLNKPAHQQATFASVVSFFGAPVPKFCRKYVRIYVENVTDLARKRSYDVDSTRTWYAHGELATQRIST